MAEGSVPIDAVGVACVVEPGGARFRFRGRAPQWDGVEATIERPEGAAAATEWLAGRLCERLAGCVPADPAAVAREAFFWGVDPASLLVERDPLHLAAALCAAHHAPGRPAPPGVAALWPAAGPGDDEIVERDTDVQWGGAAVCARAPPEWLTDVLRASPELALCGGGALALACGGGEGGWAPSDWDLYAVGAGAFERGAVEAGVRRALAALPGAKVVATTAAACTVVSATERVQFVRAPFGELQDVFDTFDLDCCRVALWRGELVTDSRGRLALQTRCSEVNWRTWGPASLARARKYAARGFALRLPARARAARAWPWGRLPGASPVDALLCDAEAPLEFGDRADDDALSEHDAVADDAADAKYRAAHGLAQLYLAEESGGLSSRFFDVVRRKLEVDAEPADALRAWCAARSSERVRLTVAPGNTDELRAALRWRGGPLAPRACCASAEEFFAQRRPDASGLEVDGYLYVHQSRMDVLLRCEPIASHRDDVLWWGTRSVRPLPLLLELEDAPVTDLRASRRNNSKPLAAVRHAALERVAQLMRHLSGCWYDEVGAYEEYLGEAVPDLCAGGCGVPPRFSGALTVRVTGTSGYPIGESSFRLWTVTRFTRPLTCGPGACRDAAHGYESD